MQKRGEAMGNTKKAVLSALIAQVIFGFSFMATKIALEVSSPLTVIANRYMVAIIALTLLLFTGKFEISLKGKKLSGVLLMSLFQPVLYFIFESYGIDMTTSAFSSVMIALIPVASIFSGMIMLSEKGSVLQYIFTVLSVLGVTVVALQGKSEGTVTFLGVLLLFGAVISSTLFNTMSRKISGEFTAFERTYIQTIVGLVSFLILALIEKRTSPVKVVGCFLNIDYVLAIFYLGVVSSVIAFLLLNFANTHLPVAKTTVFSNLTTVVSVLAGALFMDEKIGVVSAIGIIMIITGVWGAQSFGLKKGNRK